MSHHIFKLTFGQAVIRSRTVAQQSRWVFVADQCVSVFVADPVVVDSSSISTGEVSYGLNDGRVHGAHFREL
jgi:hypothetical protein